MASLAIVLRAHWLQPRCSRFRSQFPKLKTALLACALPPRWSHLQELNEQDKKKLLRLKAKDVVKHFCTTEELRASIGPVIESLPEDMLWSLESLKILYRRHRMTEQDRIYVRDFVMKYGAKYAKDEGIQRLLEVIIKYYGVDS